jgi:type 1 fimbria pilin
MMRLQRALSLGGLVALTIAATAPALADGDAGVNGKVVDALTKTPLAATLTITDESGYTVKVPTDLAGGFNAVGLHPGRLTVSFLAPGFTSQAYTCNVPANETGRFDFSADTHVRNGGPVAYRCHLEPATVDRSTMQ